MNTIHAPTKALRGQFDEPPADLLLVLPPKIDANTTSADANTTEDGPPVVAPFTAESTLEEVPTMKIVAPKLPTGNAPSHASDEISPVDAPIDEPAEEIADPTLTTIDGEPQGEVSETSPIAERSNPLLGSNIWSTDTWVLKHGYPC